MEYEQAQLIILDYAMDLSIPKYIATKHDVEIVSFSKWAVEELLQELKKKRSISPADAVKDFSDRMVKYAAKHSDFSSVFSIAYCVASDIYEILYDMERKERTI